MPGPFDQALADINADDGAPVSGGLSHVLEDLAAPSEAEADQFRGLSGLNPADEFVVPLLGDDEQARQRVLQSMPPNERLRAITALRKMRPQASSGDAIADIQASPYDTLESQARLEWADHPVTKSSDRMSPIDSVPTRSLWQDVSDAFSRGSEKSVGNAILDPLTAVARHAGIPGVITGADLEAGAIQARSDMLALGARLAGQDQMARDVEREAEIADARANTVNQGRLAHTVRGVTRSMIPMALSGPLGPAGMIGTASGIRGAQAVSEAEDAGLTGADKYVYVTRAATIEALPALIFQRMGLGGTEQAVSEWLHGAVNQGVKDALIHAGKRIAVQELPEELITSAADLANQKLSGVDPSSLTAGQVYETVLDTTLQTLLGGGAAHAPHLARAYRDDRDAAALAQAEQSRAALESMSPDRVTGQPGVGPTVITPEAAAAAKANPGLVDIFGARGLPDAIAQAQQAEADAATNAPELSQRADDLRAALAQADQTARELRALREEEQRAAQDRAFDTERGMRALREADDAALRSQEIHDEAKRAARDIQAERDLEQEQLAAQAKAQPDPAQLEAQRLLAEQQRVQQENLDRERRRIAFLVREDLRAAEAGQDVGWHAYDENGKLTIDDSRPNRFLALPPDQRQKAMEKARKFVRINLGEDEGANAVDDPTLSPQAREFRATQKPLPPQIAGGVRSFSDIPVSPRPPITAADLAAMDLRTAARTFATLPPEERARIRPEYARLRQQQAAEREAAAHIRGFNEPAKVQAPAPVASQQPAQKGGPNVQEEKGQGQAAPLLNQQPASSPTPAAPGSTRADPVIPEMRQAPGAEVFDQIGHTKRIDSRITKLARRAARVWISAMPTFQGGKQKMAISTIAAIDSTLGQDAQKITEVHDLFGGGGSWGLFLTMTRFPNAKKLVVREYDADRLAKIRLFHEQGDRFLEIAQRSGAMEIARRMYAEVHSDQVAKGKADPGEMMASAAGLAGRLGNAIRDSASLTPEQRAVLAAIRDYGYASFGKRSFDGIMKLIAEHAAGSKRAADAFRARGGVIQHEGGSSFDANIPSGPNVAAVADPPYYGTASYNDYEGASRVEAPLYENTAALMEKLSKQGNSVIYTDEAWWAKRKVKGKDKGKPDVPPDWEKGIPLLDRIQRTLDRFDITDKLIAGRNETLGIINGFQRTNEQRSQPAGQQQPARVDDRGAQPVAERAPAVAPVATEPAGQRNDGAGAVQPVAARTEAEGRPAPTGESAPVTQQAEPSKNLDRVARIAKAVLPNNVAVEVKDGAVHLRYPGGAHVQMASVGAEQIPLDPAAWFDSVAKQPGALKAAFSRAGFGAVSPPKAAWLKMPKATQQKVMAELMPLAAISDVSGRRVGLSREALVKLVNPEKRTDAELADAVEEEEHHFTFSALLGDKERTIVRDELGRSRPELAKEDPASRAVMEAAYEHWRQWNQDRQRAAVTPKMGGIFGRLLDRIRGLLRFFSKSPTVSAPTAAQVWEQLDAVRGRVASGETANQQTQDGSSEAGANQAMATSRLRFSVNRLGEMARQNEHMRYWYDAHQPALRAEVGDDAPIMNLILAATSQRNTVPGNVTEAVEQYRRLLAGQPFYGLPAHQSNLEMIRNGLKAGKTPREIAVDLIRGGKIAEFTKAILGDPDGIAVDMHVGQLLYDETDPSAPGLRERVKARIREIAANLGWEPRQVQAALWAANIARRGEKVWTYADALQRPATRDALAKVREEHAPISSPDWGRGNAGERAAAANGERSSGKQAAVSETASGKESKDLAYSTPRFTVKSEKLIAKLPPKAKAEQVEATLRNNGINDRELEWTGLGKLLADKKAAGQTVTREEIAACVGDWYGKNITEERLDDSSNDAQSKFGQYTHPGGEKYREVLVTLNGGSMANARDKAAMRLYNKRYNEIPADMQRQVDSDLREFPESAVGSSGVYKSSHWSQPNVLFHLRLKDRVTVDGKPMLHVEEVQSDWHQAGRDRGYRGDLPDEKGWTARASTDPRDQFDGFNIFTIYGADGKEIRNVQAKTADEAIEKARQSEAVGSFGVPNAPFRKTWEEIGFKRALMEAVATGKKVIGWTTGEQQADRFDLSRQVKQIRYQKRGEAYDVWASDEHGRSLNDTVDKQGLFADQIADFVGKDVARRIVSGEGRNEDGDMVLEGVDLKVGGEGMKAAYDQRLVSIANKIGKKYGIQAGKSAIESNDDNGTDIHSLEIPDQMAEDIKAGVDLAFATPRIKEGDGSYSTPAQHLNDILPREQAQTFQQWEDEAQQILADPKRIADIRARAQANEGLSPAEQVVMTGMVSDQLAEAAQSGNINRWREAAETAALRKVSGTRAARELASRRLDLSTAKGRREAILSYSSEMGERWQRAYTKAKNKAQREAALDNWAKQQQRIQKMLKARWGIDLSDPRLGEVFADAYSVGRLADKIADIAGEEFHIGNLLGLYVAGNLLSGASFAANAVGYPLMGTLAGFKGVTAATAKALSGNLTNEQLSSFGGASAAAKASVAAIGRGLTNASLAWWTGRPQAARDARPFGEADDQDHTRANSPIRNPFVRTLMGPFLETNRFVDEMFWTIGYHGALASAAAERRMAGRQQSMDELIQNPDAEMIERASAFADWLTLRGRPESEVGKRVVGAINTLRSPTFGGHAPKWAVNPLYFTMPFFNAIAQLTIEGIKLSPMGMIGSVAMAAKRGVDAARSDEKSVRDTSSAKAIANIAYLLGGLGLMGLALIPDDDEEDKYALRGSPTDSKSRGEGEIRRKAENPRTFLGVDYSRLDPVALPAALHADFRDAVRAISGGKDAKKEIMALGEKAMNSTIQRQFLSGIEALFKPQYDENGEPKGIVRKWAENAAQTLIPGRPYVSTYRRLTETQEMQRPKDKLGGAYDAGRPARNLFGENETTREDTPLAAAIGLVTPPHGKPSPDALRWMERIHDNNEKLKESGGNDWWPQPPSRSWTNAGKTQRWSDDDYDRLQEIAGKKWLELLQSSSALSRDLAPAMEMKVIQSLHSAANKYAAGQVRKEAAAK